MLKSNPPKIIGEGSIIKAVAVTSGLQSHLGPHCKVCLSGYSNVLTTEFRLAYRFRVNTQAGISTAPSFEELPCWIKYCVQHRPPAPFNQKSCCTRHSSTHVSIDASNLSVGTQISALRLWNLLKSTAQISWLR